MTLEELIDRFKNNLSLMVELQAEEMKMRFTEYDLKTIVYYLSELRYLKGLNVLTINDLHQVDIDKLQKLINTAKLSIMPIEHTAKWRRVLDGAWFYEQCTACNTVHDVKSNYCPNCGAKMEGSEDGETV